MYIIQHMKKTKLKYLLMAAAFIMIFYIGQAGSLLSEGIEKAGLGDENKKNQQIIIGYYPAWKSYCLLYTSRCV